MKLTQEEFYEKETKLNIYVFRLEKFGKYHEFFIKQKNSFKKWVKILKLYCVSCDYELCYKTIGPLGSGHFAKVINIFQPIQKFYKVYKVVAKENTDFQFAAKVFEKNKEFYDQKVINFFILPQSRN